MGDARRVHSARTGRRRLELLHGTGEMPGRWLARRWMLRGVAMRGRAVVARCAGMMLRAGVMPHAYMGCRPTGTRQQNERGDQGRRPAQ